jgi:hypothetical protein
MQLDVGFGDIVVFSAVRTNYLLIAAENTANFAILGTVSAAPDGKSPYGSQRGRSQPPGESVDQAVLFTIGDLASFEASTMRLPLKGRSHAVGFAIAPQGTCAKPAIKVVVKAQTGARRGR